jgi:hypothetical protein
MSISQRPPAHPGLSPLYEEQTGKTVGTCESRARSEGIPSACFRLDTSPFPREMESTKYHVTICTERHGRFARDPVRSKRVLILSPSNPPELSRSFQLLLGGPGQSQMLIHLTTMDIPGLSRIASVEYKSVADHELPLHLYSHQTTPINSNEQSNLALPSKPS